MRAARRSQGGTNSSGSGREKSAAKGGKDARKEERFDCRGKRAAGATGHEQNQAKPKNRAARQPSGQRDRNRRAHRVGNGVDSHRVACEAGADPIALGDRLNEADHHESPETDHEIGGGEN